MIVFQRGDNGPPNKCSAGHKGAKRSNRRSRVGVVHPTHCTLLPLLPERTTIAVASIGTNAYPGSASRQLPGGSPTRASKAGIIPLSFHACPDQGGSDARCGLAPAGRWTRGMPAHHSLTIRCLSLLWWRRCSPLSNRHHRQERRCHHCCSNGEQLAGSIVRSATSPPVAAIAPPWTASYWLSCRPWDWLFACRQQPAILDGSCACGMQVRSAVQHPHMSTAQRSCAGHT
jgi:hypothetical protein